MKREPGKVFQADRSDEGVVTARAWVEPSEYEPGAAARCWIRFENRTGGPITGLRFELAQALPSSLNSPAQADFTSRINRELKGRLGAPGLLPAGGVRLVSGPPRCLSKKGKACGSDFYFVYRWNVAAENRLLVGPLDVPGLKERWMRVGSAIYGVGKDLALPFALAFLTLAFSHWEKDRDERNKRADEARDAARHAAEQERDAAKQAAEHKSEQIRKETERHTQQARETWSRMLLISHRDAKRFYLPLLSSVRRLTDAMEEPRKDGWQDLAFFHLMMFLHLMARLRAENGGFYLKSRAGEDALAGLWFLLQEDAIQTFKLEHMEPAVESIRRDETFASFQMKKASSRFADLRECDRSFADWLGKDFTAQFPLLKLFYWILRYEANLAYVYWYGEIEAPPIEKIDQL